MSCSGPSGSTAQASRSSMDLTALPPGMGVVLGPPSGTAGPGSMLARRVDGSLLLEPSWSERADDGCVSAMLRRSRPVLSVFNALFVGWAQYLAPARRPQGTGRPPLACFGSVAVWPPWTRRGSSIGGQLVARARAGRHGTHAVNTPMAGVRSRWPSTPTTGESRQSTLWRQAGSERAASNAA